METTHIDLVILDLMMPTMDGYTFLKTMRDSGSSIPGADNNRPGQRRGRPQGVHDGHRRLLVKPVDDVEMILRIRALLRRARISEEQKITVGSTTLIYDSFTLIQNGTEVQMPKKEFQILFKLLSFPNKTFTRANLMEEFWDMDSESEARTVDVHINRLRDRLKDNKDIQIVTVRGLGYKAVKTADQAAGGVMKNKKRKSSIFTRLGAKLSLLILIITVSADVLSFSARISIDMIVSNGSSDTENIIASVVSSIIIGTLMSFIVSGLFLKPLVELIKATKQVSQGDYSVQVDMGWAEKHTVRELSDLIKVFNEMTRELNNNAMFNQDFIASFSHEFKTPLVSIRGFAQQLYNGNLTPEQQKEFSKIILEETEYLSELSTNTLLLTRLETTDIISKEEFSLDEQLRTCMLRLEPHWSEKNIDLSMELDEVKFFWNEQMLEHVWNNLFDNAVKFTPEGGSIFVSCHRSAGVITIRVRDTGTGIPQNALPHIFEKFYQADSSHATKGNGLGLPLAKKIVEVCGGRIGVQSDLGKGTEFTVILPDGGNLLGKNSSRSELNLGGEE